MATETEHSPLPWRLDELLSTALLLSDDKPEGRHLANIFMNDGGDAARSDDERFANARLIVRSVNCHDELLAALKQAKDIIKIWHGSNAWEIYDNQSPEMKMINAAILKATKP